MSLVKANSTARTPSRPSVQAFAGRRAADPRRRRGVGRRLGVAALMRSPRRSMTPKLSLSASPRLRSRRAPRASGVRRQVIGGAQEGRLVGVGGGDLGHDPAAEDDDRPVADELDLLELGGVEEDRRAGLRQLAQQSVDLALGADVDAAGRVEAEHRPDAAGDPARDGDLLLVAARQAPDLAAARVSIWSRLDGARDPPSLGGRSIGPQSGCGPRTAGRCSRVPNAA